MLVERADFADLGELAAHRQRLWESQRGYVEAQLKLFDTWYAEWSKLPGAVQTYKASA